MAKTNVESVKVKNGTVIKTCTCKHNFQDVKYGKTNRVHNIGKKKTTCTVCGVSKLE
jgi:hypothetical protein